MANTLIDARPAVVDLNIYQGDDLVLDVTVMDNAVPPAPFDLTGYTAEAQLRAATDSVSSVDMTATVLANVVTVTLAAADSATLPLKGVWDVQVTSATGVITTLAGGKFTLYGDVTR